MVGEWIRSIGLTDTKDSTVSNKVLLYNTGNDIQYLVITYNGKQPENKIYGITLLYTWNLHNIINQRYFNKEKR